MTAKRQYPRWQVESLVDRYHVSASEDEIASAIRTRAEAHKWPRGQITLAVKDALARHRKNGNLYHYVMSGGHGCTRKDHT